MIVQFKFRRATSAEWASENPVLESGEPGYDTTIENWKIGNGTEHWLDLPYQADGDIGALLTQAQSAITLSTAASEDAAIALDKANEALGYALSGGGGAVASVNGLTGTVVLTATDVGAATPADITSAKDRRNGTNIMPNSGMSPLSALIVFKDPTTGFWPTSYNSTTGLPVYTGGAPNTGKRPTTRTDLTVMWIGADPSPASVTTGDAGKQPGDIRLVL